MALWSLCLPRWSRQPAPLQCGTPERCQCHSQQGHCESLTSDSQQENEACHTTVSGHATPKIFSRFKHLHWNSLKKRSYMALNKHVNSAAKKPGNVLPHDIVHCHELASLTCQQFTQRSSTDLRYPTAGFCQLVQPKKRQARMIINDLIQGKIYRKNPYLMAKSMVSCRFSLTPIHGRISSFNPSKSLVVLFWLRGVNLLGPAIRQ